MTKILRTNTRLYEVIKNDDNTLTIKDGPASIIENIGLLVVTVGGVDALLNRCIDYPGTFEMYLAEEARKKAERNEAKEKEIKEWIAGLSEFWQDVYNSNGMDVCTPFMNKFPGHSFVAYDRGYVWSKTMQTVFLLHNHTGSFHYWPKAHKKVVPFGSDKINEL